MDRRKFVKGSLVAAAGMAMARRGLAGPLISTGAKRPNIIIILCDDLGFGDLGCYGSEAIATPNLDRMAGEGIKLTNFYSSAPVCSPSRAGLLTGRYPPRTKITQVLFPSTGVGAVVNTRIVAGGAALALPKDEITVADLMKKAGYATCCLGKWHLGDRSGFRPNDRGFDHYLGLLYSNDMIPLPLWRNGEIVEKSPCNQDLLTGKYADEALWFIKQNQDRPFFLYLAHTFPHQPLHASPDFRGKSKGGLYGDCVEEIDWSAGKILALLAELGLAENTLVIFTSDNGPWYQGNPGYRRGRKNDSFDGGMNVPFLARWPGKIAAGKTSSLMGMNFDLFATSLAVAGAEVPGDRVIDGRNLLPVLCSQAQAGPHERLYYYKGKTLEAVRSQRFKYQLRHYVYYSPVGQAQGPWLFDLEDDPNESYNVSALYPEVFQQFSAEVEDWQKNFGRGMKV